MACRKRKYATRLAASRAAERFLRKGGDWTRPYLCLDCECWHLTHLEFWKVINGETERRMVAEQQRQEILRDELAYLRSRLKELGEQIKQEQALVQFQQECDALEAKVLKELGL